MVNEKNFKNIHLDAQVAAIAAVVSMRAQFGDCGACGFAWVTVYNIRSNSKLGKALIAEGFRKADGGLQIWNPSKSFTQSMGILEAGAEAYARVLREAGLDAYSGSRMD